MMQGEAVRIRAARASDLDTLVAYNAAMALETESKTLDPAVLRAGVARVLAEPARGFYLVAEVEGAVAGCLMITFEWSDWRNGDWWWLQSVYVVPAHRRHGVFRALYQEVEHRATERADVVGVRLYVERDNARAQQTYEAFGMCEDQYRMYGKKLRPPVGKAVDVDVDA
ncbi:MAG TPA: GNAT family N-acetyltransferase [Rudaea sp.]|jgi:GNAT superfamily N-acetyltransferase|nr:GNAT family N-acetyltransferase [Rudaea sp.]